MTEPTTTADKWASRTIFLAGVLLILGGAFQALLGISAIRNDQVFVVGIKYIWQLDLTAWGWIHLLIGAAIITVAIFLLRGARWAAWAGIALAGLSALANFLFIPQAPIWAIVIIALDVAIIWALATRRETIHLLDD